MLSTTGSTSLSIYQWRTIDQLVDIDVLRQKSGPIDQSDQLINGAQHRLWKVIESSGTRAYIAISKSDF
jgi:hypothetical protein